MGVYMFDSMAKRAARAERPRTMMQMKSQKFEADPHEL